MIIAMKKYLIRGTLALFVGGMMASCADEGEYIPLAQQKLQAFEQVFKDVYGDIAPNQDWGFSDEMILADGDSVEATIVENETPATAGTRAMTRATEAEWAQYAHSYNDYLNKGIGKWTTNVVTVGDMTSYPVITDNIILTETNQGKRTLSDKSWYYTPEDYVGHGDGKHFRVAANTEITELFHINATWGVVNDAVIYVQGKIHLKGNTLNGVTLVVESGGELIVESETKITCAGRFLVKGGGKITINKGATLNVTDGGTCYNAGTINSQGTLIVNGSYVYNTGTIKTDRLENSAGGVFTNFGKVEARTNLDAADAYNCTIINGCYWHYTSNAGVGSLINLNNSRIDIDGRAQFNNGDQYLYNYSVVNAKELYVNATSFWGSNNTSDVAIIKTNKILFAGDIYVNTDKNQGYFAENYSWIYKKVSGKGTIYLDWDNKETYDANGNKITEDTPYTRYGWVKSSNFDYISEETAASLNVNIPAGECTGSGYPGGEVHVPVTGTGSDVTSKTENTEEWDQITNQSGRVFCEDLGQSSREDLDYNDVVFDVIIWAQRTKSVTTTTTYTWTTTDGVEDAGSRKSSQNSNTTYTPWTYYAQIQLLAAGGTIPLQVAGTEVHNAFNVGVTTMVNTLDGNSTAFGGYESKSPVYLGNISKDITFNNQKYHLQLIQLDNEEAAKAKNIPIIVNYSGNQVNELKADVGKAPHKLFVPFNTIWTSERKPLNLAYPGFGSYVNNNNNYTTGTHNQSWVNNYDSYYLYNEAHQGLANMPKVIKTKTIYNDVVDLMTSRSYSFGSTASTESITLSIDKFWPGDRIRFYGSGFNEESYISVTINGDSAPFIDTQFAERDKNGNYPATAYVEVLIDEDFCEKLNNRISNGGITLQVRGRSFTLTQIGRVQF